MTLDEKVEATLNLCTTIAVLIQAPPHKIKELRREVAELLNDLRRVEHRKHNPKKVQLRLDDRLGLMENRSEIQQIQMHHYEERRLMDEKRFQRLEYRLFPASANAA